MTSGLPEDKTDVPTIMDLRLTEGVLTGEVRCSAALPEISMLTGDGPPVPVTSTEAGAGTWTLRVKLPKQVVSDGTQAVVLVDRDSGRPLASYLVRCGVPEAGDPHDQIAVLRAEFDALKRAFLEEAWHTKMRAAEKPVIIAEVLDVIDARLKSSGDDRG